MRRSTFSCFTRAWKGATFPWNQVYAGDTRVRRTYPRDDGVSMCRGIVSYAAEIAEVQTVQVGPKRWWRNGARRRLNLAALTFSAERIPNSPMTFPRPRKFGLRATTAILLMRLGVDRAKARTTVVKPVRTRRFTRLRVACSWPPGPRTWCRRRCGVCCR
jgi:hypothetical protein